MEAIRRFARYAWFVTALTLAVILWVAFVRASKSGDGCGDHWPLCNGTVVPDASQSKTLVEFAHRATSGVAFLLVAGLCVWAFRRYGRGHAVRAAAAASGFFIVTESLIGAGLVLLRLVGDNTSVTRAVYLSVHLVNTFLLVAALALTAWWAARGVAERPRVFEFFRGRVGVAMLGSLALGVSGAVAVQFAAGVVNAALLAPVWLQIVHLLLADLLWLALVLLSAESLRRSEGV